MIVRGLRFVDSTFSVRSAKRAQGADQAHFRQPFGVDRRGRHLQHPRVAGYRHQRQR